MNPSSGAASGWPLDRLPHQWRQALLPLDKAKCPRNPDTQKRITGWSKQPPGTYDADILNRAPAVGLRLGPISGGTLALDFDGPDSEPLFKSIYGRPSSTLPPSVTWTSGLEGRRQVVFTVPKHRWEALRDRKAELQAPAPSKDKLEHRWDGQQSVILGAHPETDGYRWLEGCAPWEVPVAVAPDWLLDLMPSKRPGPRQPQRKEPAPIKVLAGGLMPFRDFISRDCAELIDRGSVAGSCNDDGMKLSMELVAVEAWLRSQGATPSETASEAYACYLSHCPDWIDRGKGRRSEPFDTDKAWKRFEGAAPQNPTPSTPEDKLLSRLAYHQNNNNRGTSLLTVPQGNVDQIQAQTLVPQPQKTRRSGKRELGFGKRMACFNRCVEIQSKRQRNTLTRRARLLKAAKDLDLHRWINRQEISQRVLETKARQLGHHFKALDAADRLSMERPVVQWLIPELIPATDTTIVGGRPKTGKSRLTTAISKCVLTGNEVMGFRPEQTRPVILVTDDQADGDTADMLDTLKIWDHPSLFWSRSFRLTESDLDDLLETVRANPGALTILDSLRSIGRELEKGENDPEIGAILYDLGEAVTEAGGTLLIVHHCNKSDGLIGTEALSGHLAIAGAANTILTLHYLQGPDGKPVKDAPERRLVREARSGQSFDLVISATAGTGSFHRVGTFAQWQEQAQQATSSAKREQSLTPYQRRVLEVLEASGDWLTRRQVCEELDVPWGDRGKDPEARKVADVLRRLVSLDLVESIRTGTEASFLALSLKTARPDRTTRPVSQDSGSDALGQFPDNPDNPDNRPEGQAVAGLAEDWPVTETPDPDSLAGLSGLSGPLRSPPAEIRESTTNAPEGTAGVGSGWDVEQEGEDPSWRPRHAAG